MTTFSLASTSAIWKRNKRTLRFNIQRRIYHAFTTPGSISSPVTCIRIISRRNSQRSSDCLASPSNIIWRTSSHAWQKMRSNRRRLAWHGTAPATAWTERSGAANSCSSKEMDLSNASRISDNFDYRAAIARLRSRVVARLGLLYEIFGDGAWDFPQLVADLSEQEKSLLRQMLEKQINAPLTSSVGRLFDAVAALVGLRQTASFEGQAAMELEFTRQGGVADAYSFVVTATAANRGGLGTSRSGTP